MKKYAFPEIVVPIPGLEARIDHVSLREAEVRGLADLSRFPRSLRVLAEGVLRSLPEEDARSQIAALGARQRSVPVSFSPDRALLQDFMGIPLMTDVASMRDALARKGVDPRKLQPHIQVDFVVDHSLTAVHTGRSDALELNRQVEMERNRERFAFIKWCQKSFDNFRVIPPGRGIMHQVNLEWLASVVALKHSDDGSVLAIPDTMIGTDSHTTMVNALGVLGWGVGGIEAEAAILGMPLELVPPRVVGMRLEGALRPGVTATDLVLHMTEKLRKLDVVGAFVEFHSTGVGRLPVADRATIANMAPEYGATCAYFPIDRLTIDYLMMTGRSTEHTALVEAYAKAQGLWQNRDGGPGSIAFDEEHVFDLETVEPSLAGPTRPQDRVRLADVPASFANRLTELGLEKDRKDEFQPAQPFGHGAVVIAAITSCTNTSNPAVMMAAGLLARNAVRRGLAPKPWVKTSLSPGSRIVSDYLTAAGLTKHLDALGFQNIGYGCATCNGNSGPLADPVAVSITDRNLCTVGVLSGNRNFEGRVHPQIKAAYLASPPLVIVYALAGTIDIDLEKEPVGTDTKGNEIFLKDLWPSDTEIAQSVTKFVKSDLFADSYGASMENTESWAALETPSGVQFLWDTKSTFIKPSPFAEPAGSVGISSNLTSLRPLLVLGNSITTDHISPNGAIREQSPAGRYLIDQGVPATKLGNFGARRGNPDVCVRGMFDNALLANELVNGARGNITVVYPGNKQMTIFEASEIYRDRKIGTVIVAGRNYGAGSSRDWAAKGLRLLGVVAVMAESFERIHKSNMVGMGILPLVFPEAMNRESLELRGDEQIDIDLPRANISPDTLVAVTVRWPDGEVLNFEMQLQAETQTEARMLEQGGILPTLMDAMSSEGNRHRQPDCSAPSN